MSYKRKLEENRRLKKMAQKVMHGWGRGAWFDPEKGHYIRYYNPPIFGYWCKVSNRRFRHKKEEIIGHSIFKKTGVDPWWRTW